MPHTSFVFITKLATMSASMCPWHLSIAQSHMRWFPKKGVKIYSDISQLNIVKLLTVMYSVKRTFSHSHIRIGLKMGSNWRVLKMAV